MCGVTGFWAPPGLEDPRGVLDAMTDAVAHRGPDARGTWLDGDFGIALGHRRLSIVDLSESGRQPMRSASGRYTICFNGEVFNFPELRADLERDGAAPAWRGHSDTEVMLAAIEAWGLAAAVERFVGMFAFALWDSAERRLHLVRDRLGIKPMHWAKTPAGLCFGSELKSLRRFPRFDRGLDALALEQYLRANCVPAPRTIYQAARKLEPGTILTFERPGASPKETRYWSAHDAAQRGLDAPFAGDARDAADELEKVLKRAVRLRLVADVPLGAFLSGGIDSSTVVALMQAQSSAPINTFSIANEDAALDESATAAAVARHLGTHHTTLVATPGLALEVIPRLAGMYDEPFSDSSQIPTWLVAKLARPHVTVALSGDGGDEVFGGYNRHVWAPRLWSALGRVPVAAREVAARGLTALSPDAWDRLFAAAGPLAPRVRVPGVRVHKLAGLLASPSTDALYEQLVSHWTPRDGLLRGRPGAGTTAPAPLERAGFAEQMMYRDLVTYLPDDILTEVDRASMAVSLETRVPLLDHHVVELAWTLPLAQKIRGTTGKLVLRDVLHRYVPAALVSGPKTGFGIPLGQWLRGPLKDWAEALLAPDRLAREGFFEPRVIRQRWAEHLSGQRPWEHHLWDVLMFQAWLEAERA